ncbi:MAG TPA: DUF2249 domain-containing protein [Candidatus Baltobacteraceae bacterium]|jgi:uncharacterized protein (DUF2249 family)|nr:DUF2249 domain-containing protein [Candidatus Baltobacteraceae bacterium]
MIVVRMDNRGLQPPQPMVRILAACDTLQPGDKIEADMDRRPMFLFPELDERGFTYACSERPGGGYVLTVERP